MKTLNILAGLTCMLWLATRVVAQPTSPPPADDATKTNATPAVAENQAAADSDPKQAAAQEPPASAQLPAGAAEAPAQVAPVADATPPTASEPVKLVADGEKGLRLNFRGAPLELVLNYLSEAAGFIIVPETDVRGKVDVWSSQPLTKDEAVEVLSQVLGKNGYAVLRNGRTLTVVSKEDAKKRDIPVISGYEPSSIPKTDAIVTQIIPVRFINAVQLSKDLAPLVPSTSTLTANEGGNALVITDTQTNIRRMAEIIKALDTTVSSLAAVRVFALKYADAKAVATVIKDVFSTTDSTRSNNQRSQMFNFGRGGGGPPGMGGDAGGGGSGSSGGRPGAGRVVATADERSNSLIVSAPDDLMTTIESMVTAMDTTVEDVTEVRVFKLRHSDPVEMADLLTSLFPDESKNSNNSGRAGMRFGGMGGPGMQMAAAVTSNGQSDRLLKQTRVMAVPDQRTGSVVVSASRDLMNQIGKMIEQLDENPAKKQKVFVYELKNADVQNAEDVVRNLFQGQNSRNTSSGQNSSALATREQQMQNQQNSGMNSGFGSGNSGGQQRLQ